MFRCGANVFKVPSLRNVAMTAPYFHDGSVDALPQTVRIMSRVQLGKDLAESHITEIVAFLKSHTGPLPTGFATAPTMPSGLFTTS